MEYQITQRLQKELAPGESLLWSGRPRRGFLLRGSDLLMVPFSLFWAGFAVFWEYNVYNSGAPLFFMLFGGVFVAVGVYIVLGRFVVDAMKRKKTYYGVTDDRVMILTEFPVHRLKSLNLRTLSDVTFSNRSDGSGTITFGPQHPMAGWLTGLSWPGTRQYQGPMFEYIRNVRTAYQTIRDAQKRLG